MVEHSPPNGISLASEYKLKDKKKYNWALRLFITAHDTLTVPLLLLEVADICRFLEMMHILIRLDFSEAAIKLWLSDRCILFEDKAGRECDKELDSLEEEKMLD